MFFSQNWIGEGIVMLDEGTDRAAAQADPVDAATGFRRFAGRVQRHWEWGRTQGFGRLIEEDQLNPLARIASASSKWWWRTRHGVAKGTATPVYLVGLQRSGTNMIVRGLEAAPEFEVHNENDTKAFDRFRLRDLAVVRRIVNKSRHQFVLFKPLIDSHRTPELLDDDTMTPGKAIWAYREVDGRVRSALAKFGDNNLRALRAIADGKTAGVWQAEGMSPRSLEIVRSFDYATMSADSAAALFWFLRNSLYFDRGLDTRDDVLLVSYDALLADPEPQMRRVVSFLGFPYDARLVAHIAARPSPHRAPLAIDPVVRAHCDELQARLDAHAGGTA